MINSAIYNGQVIHKRFKPKAHYFKYKVFSLLIDLSELETLDKNVIFFSFNKFNLISFHEKDHGERNGSSLKLWVHQNLEKNNIQTKNKKAWCSWNSSLNPQNKEQSSVTYWLNQLQNLKIDQNIFLTINSFFKIDQDKIFNEIDFTHPYYDDNALQNQSKLKSIQNVNNTLFTGSYFGYGFHEDGIKSSIEILKAIND